MQYQIKSGFKRFYTFQIDGGREVVSIHLVVIINVCHNFYGEIDEEIAREGISAGFF